jgi:2-isopropylmalate synthase
MTPDDAFHVYDTTLRDGAQQEGLSLTVADKLAIARRLDEFGVGFIEGGWPGAIPKDTEFFRRARTERSWPRAAGGVSRPAGRTRWRRRPAGRRPARVRRPVVTLVKT